ncbi:AI-2E family transporter [Micrococcus porci]|uniref:AI-2E family transporter n=1 Tax=Micrococcus porci TaxID=2856555 RepID=UPI001CCF7C61|nr:AI-2E family transporter [Micrococcus porci]UBH24225.1 AI-2E family transporter [Micrococcus porci]
MDHIEDSPAPSGPSRGARRLRLGSLVRRREAFLPNERVDPLPPGSPDAAPAEPEVPELALRAPVAAGFLLTMGVCLAAVLVWVVLENTQLLVWIAAALFIALGLDPVVRLVERWGAPRWVGVLLAALGLAAVAGAVVGMLVPAVVQQSTQLITGLPDTITQIMATPWFREVDRQLQIQHAVQSWLDGLTKDGAAVTQLFGGLVGIGQTVMNAVFSTIVVVVLALYFLASLPHLKYWGYRLAPRSKRLRVEALGEEITLSVGHYVMGQTVVAVLNGTVAFIALSVAGGPFPVLLAFVAAVMAFIPLVGALIGGTILTAVCLLESWQAAALFAAIYFVYLQIEAYVVSPRVMARAVAVPAAVGVIAVIAGGTLLGVLGALMAIPTAAAVLLIVREVLIPRQDAR